MFSEKIKKFILIIFLPIIFILIIEIILRTLVFILISNPNIFYYGINKNISLNLHSIKEKEFYITNNNKKLRNSNKINLDEKNQIWVFGGSTSNKGFCDSKSLSWVDFLEVPLLKKNFSKNGINSNFSLKLLINELEKMEKPKIILWANKVNEPLYIKRNSSSKDNIFYIINSLKKTFKENLVFFYLFDEVLVRVFDKIGVNIRLEKLNFSKDDYILSAENYFNNTELALEISKTFNIEKFFIVSLFNKANLENSETIFYDYYKDKVLELLKLYDNVEYIDTSILLKPDEKKLELFCDPMHQNLNGKLITAKIISKYINDTK